VMELEVKMYFFLGSEVIVATPNKLLSMLLRDSNSSNPSELKGDPVKAKRISLTGVQTLILDEVDALFSDDTFKLSSIGDRLPATTQFLFVTATLTRQTKEIINEEFGVVETNRPKSYSNDEDIKVGLKTLTGPGLHKIAPTILFSSIIDCSKPSEFRPMRQPDWLDAPNTGNVLNLDTDDDGRANRRTDVDRSGHYPYRDEDGSRQFPASSSSTKSFGLSRVEKNKLMARDTIEDNKCEALVHLLITNTTAGHSMLSSNFVRTIVFCNSIFSCRAAENALSRGNRKSFR
jgi:superfamily II DNA/RNA helicase